MECQYCNKVLSSKSSLNLHQKSALYCLKIQGKDIKNIKNKFTCKLCGRIFLNKNRYKSHTNICKSNKELCIKENERLRLRIIELEKLNISNQERCKMLREQVVQLQARYDKLSLTAVKRPTISNKTMNINNFIKNMQPIRVQDIESSVPLLTLEHHAKGAEGYAEFALEFPFKDKIVCVDVSRNKIKYKNDDGDIIEDVGFRKMMIKLCKSLKDRSFNLSLEHEDKLSDTWSEQERDSVDFMEAAVAIAKYAQGRENEFCNKIIKLISKGSTSPL